MFHKDFYRLNEIYNNKIIKESVDTVDYSGVDNTGERVGSLDIPGTKVPLKRPCQCSCEEMSEEPCDCCKQTEQDNEENCECEGGMMEDEERENAGMAKQSLFRTVKLAAMLHDLISSSDHVEPWVLSKITEAQRSIESVYGYQDYENFKKKVEGDMENIEEETEQDLYNSISSGGGSIVNVLKRLLATE